MDDFNWMNRRPISISKIISWLESEEIGVIESSPEVDKKVHEWAAESGDFDPKITIPRDEIINALCSHGIDGVEDVIDNYLKLAASYGMAWGAITALQRLSDPQVGGHEIY